MKHDDGIPERTADEAAAHVDARIEAMARQVERINRPGAPRPPRVPLPRPLVIPQRAPLGRRIAVVRRHRGLSQQQLAGVLGKSRAAEAAMHRTADGIAIVPRSETRVWYGGHEYPVVGMDIYGNVELAADEDRCPIHVKASDCYSTADAAARATATEGSAT
jgi:hypothetical protein